MGASIVHFIIEKMKSRALIVRSFSARCLYMKISILVHNILYLTEVEVEREVEVEVEIVVEVEVEVEVWI